MLKSQPVVGALILLPWAVFAQAVSEPTRLPTIDVTDSANAIQQPRAVDELTGDQLQLRSIQKLDDLQSQVPNLVARSGGSRSLNNVIGFRGLVNNAFYGDPAVALYVDDVPYATTLSYDTSFLEIGRMDLFRGPQFTRWGRQGPAGVISITSREPSDRIGIRASASYGEHDDQQYKLNIDGPIGKQFSFSLGGMYSKRDGYLYNDLLKFRPDYQEGLVGRLSLQWRPTDRLEFQLTGVLQHYDDGVQRWTNLDPTPRVIEHDFSGLTKGRSDVESLRVRYTGDDLIFTSITARRDFRLDPASFDLDFSPLPIAPAAVVADQLQYSEELRLQPAHPGNWDWFLGAYASWSQLDVMVDDNTFRSNSELTDRTLALFGDVTRKFEHGFEVTLGLRGEVIKKSAERALRQPLPLATVGFERLEHTVANISPKLALNWHITDKLLAYASTSLSYRAGAYSVFNFNPVINSAPTERTWANEIGAKAQLLDNTLEIAVAGFWYDIENYQIERYLFSGFGVYAAEEVISRGVELEILSRPIKGLELSAGVGYTNAEFKKHRSATTGADLEGQRPPYIPDVTANFAAQYRHPSGPMARVEWLLTGQTFFDEDNTEPAAQAAYGILNARIGFEQKNWAIYVYGRNLTNTEYYTLKVPSLGAGFLGEPRTVGVMLTTTF